MPLIKITLTAIVSYLLAAYVSEFVFYCILTSDASKDPTYGTTPDSSPDWRLYWGAPFVIPIRYAFVAYSTDVGGRDSFEQKCFAIPFAVLIATFLAFCSAGYFVLRRPV